MEDVFLHRAGPGLRARLRGDRLHHADYGPTPDSFSRRTAARGLDGFRYLSAGQAQPSRAHHLPRAGNRTEPARRGLRHALRARPPRRLGAGLRHGRSGAFRQGHARPWPCLTNFNGTDPECAPKPSPTAAPPSSVSPCSAGIKPTKARSSIPPTKQRIGPNNADATAPLSLGRMTPFLPPAAPTNPPHPPENTTSGRGGQSRVKHPQALLHQAYGNGRNQNSRDAGEGVNAAVAE